MEKNLGVEAVDKALQILNAFSEKEGRTNFN